MRDGALRLLPYSSLLVIMIVLAAPRLAQVWRSLPGSDNVRVDDARAALPRTGAGEAMEQEYLLTRNPATGRVPVEVLVEVRQQRDALIKNGRQHLLAPVEDLVWEERGPNNVGGRSRVAWFDLGDAANGYKKVWAAGVGGGLWYTNDITVTNPGWVKVNDFFDNLAISAFAQHPANPQVMYFGTGEGWFNADAIEGLGIWKSIDGGSTWQRLSSTGNFAYVQDLLLDNSGNLYASLRSRLAGQAAGIQKSTDGGGSWTQVLGAPVQGPSNRGADLEMAPNGDVYASLGFFSTGRIYRSSASQGSNTGNAGRWTDITPDPVTNLVPIADGQDAYDRIEIAVPANSSNIVYALFEGNGTRNVSHIKQYNPATNFWTDKPVPKIIDQKSNVADRPVFTRGQAWYDLIALVDPNNAQRLWIGGIDALRSDDGGESWDQKTTWSLFAATGYGSGQRVHADHHIYQFAPGSSSRLIMGTDGGIDYTAEADFGGTGQYPAFSRRNSGYNVTQFYAVANHPTNPHFFLAGSQDNGTQRFNAAGMNNTVEVTGGDGGYCHIDQNEANIMITAYVRNNYYVSTNGGMSFSSRSKNNNGSFINPTDYDDYSNILYGGEASGKYFRYISPATDGAVAAVTVTAMGSASVTHVAVSPTVTNRIYLGTGNSRVVRVDDAHTGTSKSGTVIFDQAISASVSCVAIDPANENHMLVTLSNYGVNSVWETQNGGSNWTSVEGNLPDMPVRWALFDPRNSNHALLATEMGVWSTNHLNGSATEWSPTNSGLANVRVQMLQYSPQTRMLSAATHGRGLFTAIIPAATTPQVDFSAAKASGQESPDSTTGCRRYSDYPVQMTIGAAPNGTATATLQVLPGGTARRGVDYDFTTNGSFEAPSEQVTFAAGSTAPQTVTVRIYDDTEVEEMESFTLGYTLSGSSNATRGNAAQTLSFQMNDNDLVPAPPAAITVTVGSYGVSYFQPFRSDFTDAKTQMLYTASELRAAGLRAGPINTIGLEVVSKNSRGIYENFTIGIKATALNTLRGLSNMEQGLTTVYAAATYVPSVGINDFALSNPFAWDGVSNILVDICFDNTTANPASDGGTDNVKTTATGNSNDPNAPILAIWRRENSSSCSALSLSGSLYTGAGSNPINYYRPVMRFNGQSASGVIPATSLNSTRTTYLGPFSDVYVYTETGEILARVKNLTAHDYGCTEFRIDRAGTSAKAFLNNTAANFVADKTLVVTPANNNPNGELEITLYYAAAEMGGWMSATGNTVQSIQVVKTKNAITAYTPGSVPPADLELSPAPVLGSLGSATTVRGSFRTGLSAFGVGFLYPSSYVFTGNGNWSNPANWQGGVVPPPLVPAGFTITIDHVAGGEAILDVPVTLQPNAHVTVLPGKQLRLNR